MQESTKEGCLIRTVCWKFGKKVLDFARMHYIYMPTESPMSMKNTDNKI
jgi:hypothetical protein